MTVPALNLLRQPQGSAWWQLWPAAVLGAWLGGAVGVVCHAQLPALQQAQAQRRAVWAQQTQQEARAKAQRQAQSLQAAAVRVAQTRWQEQQRWHATLSALASEKGMRVQGWQGDAQQLQLQAWLPQAGDVPEVLAALNAVGPSPWRVHSLQQGAGAGVTLNLQAPLPPAALRARPAQEQP